MTRWIWFLCAAAVCTAQTATVADLIYDGHWKRARALVEARLREAPGDAAAHFYLSQIRSAFGDLTSPLPLAEQAVALDGRSARYHRQVAEVLGVMAQHSNAFQQVLLARRFRKEIEAALTLDRNDVQAYRDLTEFYVIAPPIIGGDRRKAQAVAEKLTAIDPAEGYMAQTRVAEAENRADDARALLRRAAEIRPPSYRARMALARSSPEDAEGAALDAARLVPGRVEAYAVLAERYAAQSRWAELDAILERAARAVPDDLAPYYRAAQQLATTRQDPARAERYLRTYLLQEPEGNEPTAGDAARLLDQITQRRRATQRE